MHSCKHRLHDMRRKPPERCPDVPGVIYVRTRLREVPGLLGGFVQSPEASANGDHGYVGDETL